MNNRTIKFRAWDKRNSEIRDWKWLSTASYTMQFSLFEDESFVIQQFTGLLDKNGKEIYEGDIVREWIVEDRPSDLIYIVGFNTGHFTLTDTKSGYDKMGIWNVNENLDIIGNIYSNPELLKT